MIEITSYVLGMLTIAAVLLLLALVLGMFKYTKKNGCKQQPLKNTPNWVILSFNYFF